MNAKHTILFLFLVGFHLLKSQVSSNAYAKPTFLANSLGQHKFSGSGDSLLGFDENKWRELAKAKGVVEPELSLYIAFEQRRFIRAKFGFEKTPSQHEVPVTQGKFNPGTVFTATPCLNEGFENTPVGTYTGAANANAVSGWSISSTLLSGTNQACNASGFTPGSPEFSIVSTPLFNVPSIGNILASPLGGTTIAHINDYTNNNTLTRLSTNFPVTNSNSMFFYAFAAVFLSGTHQCCDDAGFRFNVYDCNNNIVPCLSKAISPSCASESGFYNSGAGYVSNWQVRSINLTPYVGSCVTIEFLVHDCCYGGHYGTVFLDAACGTPSMSLVYNPFTPGTTVGSSGVSYCQGSNVAQISGPPGYTSYNWIAPAGSPSISPSLATLAVLSITNPIANAVYTLNYAITNASNTACTYTTTYALIPTTISLGTLNVSPTCSGGSSGSGTVLASGSSMGYTYNWMNNLNQSVGTGSVVGTLSSGTYTIIASVPNFSSCGTASTTLVIPIGPQTASYVSKPFCSGGSTVSTLTHSVGTNYIWYNLPSSVISTASSVTISGFTNNTQYALGYNHLGCRDSIIYTMFNSSPGLISLSSGSNACPGNNTGVLTVSFQPNLTNGTGPFQYSLVALNNNSTIYTNTVTSTAVFSTQVSNLAAPGSYSLTVNDGVCIASTFLNLGSLVPNYTLSPSPSSATLCAGGNVNVSVAVNNTVSNSNYTYTWNPSTFLAPNSATLPNITVSPTVTSGTAITQIYTVSVSPLNSPCIQTSTVKVTLFDLGNATVNPVPLICSKSTQFTVTAFPAGGQYISINPGISNNGIITPSLTNLGVNTATYYIQQYTCSTSVPFTYSYYITPTVGIIGPSQICSGDAVVLSGFGASTYVWSTNQTNISIVVSPTLTSTYTVTGSSVQGCKSTAALSIKVNPCLSVQTNEVDSHIQLFPNPIQSQLIVRSDVKATLKVYDAQGKCLLENSIIEGHTYFDLSKWPEGIYVYLLNTEQGAKSGKIFKTN